MTLVDMQNFQLLQILPDTLPVRSTGVRFSESFSLREKRNASQCREFAMSQIYYLGRSGNESLLQEI